MDDLRDLYQATIIDHNRSPRNFHAIENASHQAEGNNPLCGDALTVFVRIEANRVIDAGFVGSGCAISTASASLMTEFVKGRDLTEIESTFNHFHALVTGKPNTLGAPPKLGKLEVFSGVCAYPMRVKCATLSWHALKAAIDGSNEAASTE